MARAIILALAVASFVIITETLRFLFHHLIHIWFRFRVVVETGTFLRTGMRTREKQFPIGLPQSVPTTSSTLEWHAKIYSSSDHRSFGTVVSFGKDFIYLNFFCCKRIRCGADERAVILRDSRGLGSVNECLLGHFQETWELIQLHLSLWRPLFDEILVTSQTLDWWQCRF